MQFNIKRFVCHYIVISDILWILQKKWLFFEIWKFPHIFYWWSLEDNFLKILVFDIIPLIFPLWPAAKKTWLQLSLGNPCALHNFICIIIHITSNADALWACHAVKGLHDKPKEHLCRRRIIHTEIKKNPLAIYYFHNKEKSERVFLAWMYRPNKHVITGGVKNMHLKYLYWTAKCSMLA